MATDTPVHDFLRPQLRALLDTCVARGFARDVAVAVMIDIVTGPEFDTAAPDPLTDSEPHPDYERSPDDVPLVANHAVAGPPAIDRRDTADFIRPISRFPSDL